MRRHVARDPFPLGLALLALTAVLLYLAFAGWPFPGGYKVTGTFATAASKLTANSPVRIAGVNVGKVESVERGPGGTALVTMRLKDDALPLHTDATMKIRPRLFLEGNFFVDIRPGTPTAPELEDGGAIPIAQTAVPVQFDELLQVFTADTRRDNKELLQEVAAGLGDGGAAAVNRGFGDYEGAFRGTAATAEAFRGTEDGDLAGFVAEQARISQTLADRRTELGRLISGFRGTMAAFADRDDALRATLRESAGLVSDAPAGLAAIDRVLPPLERFAAAARPALRIAPAILDRSRPFLAALARATRDDVLPGLARDLRPALAGLDRFDRLATAPLGHVRTISDCTRDNFLATLEKTVPDGPFTTQQPVWQEGLRGFGPGLVGSQQNHTPNGYSTRYSVGIDQNVFVTNMPGGQDLVQLSGSPQLGSRPRYDPDRQPPLRTDVPCAGQKVPDLRSETTPPPAGQRRVRLPRGVHGTPAQALERLGALIAANEKRPRPKRGRVR